LSTVVGVDVMNHFQSEIRHCQFIASGNLGKNLWIPIGLRIDGHPAFADDVTGPKTRRWKSFSPGLL
jgi:hypothetical protein